MTKLDHYKRYLKDRYPNIPQDYNESEGYFFHDFAQFGWQAWQASPKTRPTENGRVTKERLAELKADTSDIVDNLRGIYPGIADGYPVTPLMLKAANEIERLRKIEGEPVELGFAEELAGPCPVCSKDAGFYGRAAAKLSIANRGLRKELERLREELKGYEMCPSGMQVDKDENGNVILHFS